MHSLRVMSLSQTSLVSLSGVALPSNVAKALAARGVLLGPLADEKREDCDRRLETALMALFRDRRDEASYEALYLRSRRMLLAWILHLVGGRAQGCDPIEVLQDTYVNVYRYAGGFRDEGANSFRGWVRTIAANVVRRARGRRELSLEAMPEAGRQVPDDCPGPEQSVLVEEEQDQVKRAWVLLLLHYARAYQHLSPRDRQALHMVEVDGLSYAEAGARLRVGRSNMKMIMFRSRKRIRSHILRAMSGCSGEPSLRAVS
jgi:RNA polymerase sigma-70 factor (ECF subfamily)